MKMHSGQERDPHGASGSPSGDPIAIIGMGCRFPGADSAEAFWKLVESGEDGIREVPRDRFNARDLYHEEPGTPGRLASIFGGFLDGVDRFDTDLFRVSPREACRMDPQQRLLLDVAYQTFEHAGQPWEKIAGSRTGVFVGACSSDYNGLQLHCDDRRSIDIYAIAGGSMSVLSGRISYVYGLEGPSTTIDTACSSSLVAVCMGIRSLQAGDCSMALVGGVNLVLTPELSIGFASAKMLAPDGRCKAFDSRANGFVRSDGVGLVLLKPLRRAIADGDPIHAVIRGSAFNNDGTGSGMMMPSQQGQEAVLRQAYANAGVSPADVDYVEAHGTGTPVGDPIEVAALGQVLGEERDPQARCIVGSVKTNTGHMEAAAGIAGLIKTALSLEHGTIPASLHVHELNPQIPWNDLPLQVAREGMPWPTRNRPRLAGVSAFGISGTNAHIVLEEAPREQPSTTAPVDGLQILPISAHTTSALTSSAASFRDRLRDDSIALNDLCYTAAVRRTHHPKRIAVVGRSAEELRDGLSARLPAALEEESSELPGKLVFVFSGQGSQWPCMGRALAEREPVFREAIDRCEEAMQPLIDWSLRATLLGNGEAVALDQVDVIQPSIFAMQFALAELWRSRGIVPDAVMGQSLGEVAAACFAGALDLSDAARVICRRSQLVKQTSGKGAMAVVGLTLADAREEVRGAEGRVSIAVSSGPESTVLSGDPEELGRILQSLESRSVFCRWIEVDYASHGPQMEPLRDELQMALRGLQPKPSTIPIYSTVLGNVCEGSELDELYWFRNLREPVLFADVVQRLIKEEHDSFVEVSPHPVLLSAVQQCFAKLQRSGSMLPSLRKEEDGVQVHLETLQELYESGRTIDWESLFPQRGRVLSLPPLPREAESHWHQTSAPHGRTAGQAAAATADPLLGSHVRSAVDANTHLFDLDLAPDSLPYLTDHRVRGAVVLPASAYVEMLLSAADHLFGAGLHGLEKVVLRKALSLQEGQTRRLQLVVRASGRKAAVSVYSFSPDDGVEPGTTLHAEGTILAADQPASPERCDDLEQVRERLGPGRHSAKEHYEAMAQRGLQYGPGFQTVMEIAQRADEALGRLRPVDDDSGSYRVHPTVLDGGFQVLAALLPRRPSARPGHDTWMPVSIERVVRFQGTDGACWSHARLQEGAPGANNLKGDVMLHDDSGKASLLVSGMKLERLDRRTDVMDDWFYRLDWRPLATPEAVQREDPAGVWLIVGDGGATGRDLTEVLKRSGASVTQVALGDEYRKLEPHRFELDPARRDDFERLLREAAEGTDGGIHGVVHLVGLDGDPPSLCDAATLDRQIETACGSLLHLTQALQSDGIEKTPRLFIVTRGAQVVAGDRDAVQPFQAPLWGLGRVIASEMPRARTTLVDLPPISGPDDIRGLEAELFGDSDEPQLAWRGGQRFGLRLTPQELSVEDAEAEFVEFEVAPDDSYRIESDAPGILDNLRLTTCERPIPREGEIEVQVHAAGLNFSDVMKAMAIYPGLDDGPVPLGIECAGVVTRVGPGVEQHSVGDEVMAIAPFSFGSYVRTPAVLAWAKPAEQSWEQAATIPIAFLTAYYALIHLGRLERGERVLIHAASGGVGLAAVQIARQRGAEIYATAGSPEKRAYLEQLGIRHVMDSRSLDFADEILERTDGEGVDVVLNSLSGEGIPAGMKLLRTQGRFLEIGKSDIYRDSSIGLGAFKRNISFFAIDLDRLVNEKPERAGQLCREFMQGFVDGAFEPLPSSSFGFAAGAEAFRFMAQAKHIGKIVLTRGVKPVKVVARESSRVVSTHGTYLVTGGLGGLGLAVARWLARSGAACVALAGRSGATDRVEPILEEIRSGGTQVVVLKADVARPDDVAALIGKIGRELPPLRGIVHAAGVLDDGILLQQTMDRFNGVTAPKIRGAWNLHRATSDIPLDFFVMFSSVSGVLGWSGQGNYAAGNTFLDALAHHRRTLGLPALAINWGAWGEAGLAAREDRSDWLRRQGVMAFTSEQGVRALERSLSLSTPQVMINSVDWQRFLSFQQQSGSPPKLLSEIGNVTRAAAAPPVDRTRETVPAKEDAGNGKLRGEVAGASPDKSQERLETFLAAQVGKVLGLAPEKINRQRSLITLGLDSLMATEVRNRIEAEFGVNLPISTLLKGAGISRLAADLGGELGETPPETDDPERLNRLLDRIESLSPEEVKRLLAQKRGELGRSEKTL